MIFSIENNSPLSHTIHFPVKVDMNGKVLLCEIWGQILNNGCFTWIAETNDSHYTIKYSQTMKNKKVNYRLCYRSADVKSDFTEIKNVLIK